MSKDGAQGVDSARVSVSHSLIEAFEHNTEWMVEKWSEEACDFVRARHGWEGFMAVSSADLKEGGIAAEEVMHIHGNLLLNEGLQRLRDLLVVAGGTGYNNANAYIGVGDTATAEAATQTELQATQNAANRFYKAMNATFPTTSAQLANWASDFTSGEANFVWNEWTIAAGATTASGSGFLVGTTNLNRKVASLGTKATGTWTLTGTVSFS